MKKSIIVLALISTLLIGVVVQSALYKEEKLHPIAQSDFDYLPSANYVRFLSLGEHTSIAGLLWIRAMIYFGGNTLEGKESTWFLQLADLVTTLDPDYLSVYRFIGSVTKNDTEGRALKIMEKGLPHFQKDWRICLFYSIQLIEQKEDYKKASAVLKPLLNLADTPDYVKSLAKTYETQSRPLPMAIGLFLEEYAKQKGGLQLAVGKKILRTINLYRPKNEQVEYPQIEPMLNAMVNNQKDPVEVHQILVKMGQYGNHK